MAERYVHGYDDAVRRSHGTRTVENSAAYLRQHLTPGDTVLDLGCGIGTITVGLAAIVSRVIAVDRDAGVLAETAARAKAAGVDVDVRVGDAYHLDLPDDSVDVAHAHQVLQHLADPVAALRELARVTRPGGIVAVRDADYATFAWYPSSPRLDRWLRLYRTVARAAGGEPDAGRRLLAWAHAAGLSDVVATSSTWTQVGPAADLWASTWAQRATGETFASQAVDLGLATRDDLADVAAGWLEWAADPDAWFLVPHGEILARV